MRPIIASLFAATTLAGMAAEPVMIQVSANQRQGHIEPMLYGQFIEHLGSCINGGIFDPGSPLADELGFRRDVMAKVRELNPPMLRWPGGTFTKQWWTTWSGQADAQGRCEVPAFFGKHRVTAGGKEAVVELKRKDPAKQFSLKQP